MANSVQIKSPNTTVQFSCPERNIQKVNVGRVNQSRPFEHGKVLMLLGATGAGKSTLINCLVNYIRDVQYEDKYRFRLVGDEGSGSQAHSQTKWITAYTFQKNNKLPYTFTIIDTPGYGDTSGLERDKQITKQIKEFFSIQGKEGIDQIDGIGFVVQASLARLTPTQKYIFDSILSIFGKDIVKNIFALVTFADGKKPPVLAAIKESGFEYQHCFKFNNSALFPDTSQDDDDDDSFNSMFWEMGVKSFKNFFRAFGNTQSVSLQLTKEVLQERENLECVIQGLQVKIQGGLLKVDQLQKVESQLKKHETDMETNKHFVFETEETRQRKVDLDPGDHVTNCLKCHSSCHPSCAIPRDVDKARCAAMRNGYCTVCILKCHWRNHVNNGYRFELYTEKVTRTSDDIKKRYVDAESKKSQKEQIMNGLSEELKTMYDGVCFNIFQAKSSIQRLEEIALRPNPLTEVQYIDILIKTEENEAKEGWSTRVDALIQIRKQATMLSKIKDKASYMEKLIGAAKKSWDLIKCLW